VTRPQSPNRATTSSEANADTGGGSGEVPGRPLVGSFLTTGVIQLLQAVIGVALARELGPEERGELAAAILWPTLLTTIGSLGITQAATYYAARATRIGVVVGSVLAIVAALSVALVAIGLLVVPLVLGGQEPEVVDTARIFLVIYVPLNLLGMSMMSLLNGLHRFGWFQGLRLAWIGTILGVIVALLVTDELRLETGIAAYLAAAGVMALASTFVAVSGSRPLGIRRDSTRALLSYGLKSQLSVTMWNLNERADQLVISAFFSATSLGLYVVAVTMTSLTTLIGFSFALVALPVLARLDRLVERRRTARVLVGATLFAASAVSLPLLILQPELIRLLFGESFVEAADVGRVLMVAGVVFALNRVLEAILQGVGRPLDSSIGEGIALAFTAAGLAALLPLLGILGAGITSLVAYSASALFLVRRASRALEMPPQDLLRPSRDVIAGMRGLLRLRSSDESVAEAQVDLEFEDRRS
jgi:O-antigen/teichoic acid export membrane protein